MAGSTAFCMATFDIETFLPPIHCPDKSLLTEPRFSSQPFSKLIVLHAPWPVDVSTKEGTGEPPVYPPLQVPVAMLQRLMSSVKPVAIFLTTTSHPFPSV